MRACVCAKHMQIEKSLRRVCVGGGLNVCVSAKNWLPNNCYVEQERGKRKWKGERWSQARVYKS